MWYLRSVYKQITTGVSLLGMIIAAYLLYYEPLLISEMRLSHELVCFQGNDMSSITNLKL